MTKLIVVGAGPAGLIAAGIAAQHGIDTTVFESMPKAAKKLGITGKGRCNLTNTAPFTEFLAHFNKKGRFLKHAFKIFSNNDLVSFFNKINVKTKEERGGRVFPVSDKASEIVNSLIKWANSQGVKLNLNNKIENIIIENNICKGVISQGKEYRADSVIISTGGKSYPATGSTGDGFRFALKAGHTLNKLFPSLVALQTSINIPSNLFNFIFKNVNAELIHNNKKIGSEFGEVFFQKNSLAGPIIITLSRLAVPIINKGDLEIRLDFKPALSYEKLDKRILREISKAPKSSLEKILQTLMPRALAVFVIEQNSLNAKKEASELTVKERKIIKNSLKAMSFGITQARPWSEAIVTAGGIPTNEINPSTMESKFAKCLYFAGEVIDIDADTGGYNLQAAFSTGYLAGLSVANSLTK